MYLQEKKKERKKKKEGGKKIKDERTGTEGEGEECEHFLICILSGLPYYPVR